MIHHLSLVTENMSYGTTFDNLKISFDKFDHSYSFPGTSGFLDIFSMSWYSFHYIKNIFTLKMYLIHNT